MVNYVGVLERLGISQAELSRRVGRPRATVNRWLGRPERLGEREHAQLAAGLGLEREVVAYHPGLLMEALTDPGLSGRWGVGSEIIPAFLHHAEEYLRLRELFERCPLERLQEAWPGAPDRQGWHLASYTLQEGTVQVWYVLPAPGLTEWERGNNLLSVMVGEAGAVSSVTSRRTVHDGPLRLPEGATWTRAGTLFTAPTRGVYATQASLDHHLLALDVHGKPYLLLRVGAQMGYHLTLFLHEVERRLHWRRMGARPEEGTDAVHPGPPPPGH